jgi:hypothetical protein
MTTATLTKKQEAQQEREHQQKWLREVFIKQERPTVYTILRHVSSSGMSRDISLFTMHEGKLINITWSASKASRACESLKERNGYNVIRTHGAGMDMGFHLVNSLSYALYADEDLSDRAGYVLRQEWL